MKIIKHPDAEALSAAIKSDEPLIAVISFDGGTAVVAPIEESPEHHILLMQNGFKDTDTDRFFRIVFDKSGADWTFVCPESYRDITFKGRRITAFYRDGMRMISDFLLEIGYVVGINIPTRYRRHLDIMSGKTYL